MVYCSALYFTCYRFIIPLLFTLVKYIYMKLILLCHYIMKALSLGYNHTNKPQGLLFIIHILMPMIIMIMFTKY